MSLSKITLIGNAGRDAELKYTPKGEPVCEFSLATNEKRNVNGETKEETTWFKISLFGKQGENLAQYIKKGREVYVEGNFRVREYTSKEGEKRFSLEVKSTDIRLLGAPNEATSHKNQ